MPKAVGWCWNYFKREVNKQNGKEVINGICKFCGTKYNNHAGRMVKHLQVFI
jgi:hypothetical protein